MRRIRFAAPAAVLPALFVFFATPALHAEPVNVNAADAETIAASLHGVGEKTAGAIIEYREENGLFESAEQLLEVKGIGPKTLQRNRADILLDDEAAATATD